ncbi:hypothetical protein P3T37_006295 [Kitasatospora sp. MAA4]|uniref:hypothetical protein n=1 Tax=Kitasatospora sp. MAA4 TaxID=3035093 RepID=UPI0024746690|nr:hypothetical protein [Kitasatospora sp. MAA4]MDH6136864.1 hypothetical protein [Kitasatospora sp. MAA4]
MTTKPTAPTHRLRHTLLGHTAEVKALATTMLDGRPVTVVGGWGGTLRVWELARGR